MPDDADLMEASLAAAAECDLRLALFERFFAAFPERRATFINADAASRRMTDETLQMMHGLASGASWVRHLVDELVYTHRSYGALPIEEYDAFIDMTVDVLGEAAGDCWTSETGTAWRSQASALKILIRETRAAWDRVALARAQP